MARTNNSRSNSSTTLAFSLFFLFLMVTQAYLVTAVPTTAAASSGRELVPGRYRIGKSGANDTEPPLISEVHTTGDIWTVERLPSDTKSIGSGDGAVAASTTAAYTLKQAHNGFLTVKEAGAAYGDRHLGLSHDLFRFNLENVATSVGEGSTTAESDKYRIFPFGDSTVSVQMVTDQGDVVLVSHPAEKEGFDLWTLVPVSKDDNGDSPE
ncbi:hypothetical protein BG015_000317 [Linnemannia schmuckeri]|uniref:Uncharacterized protein n=1 Tax=Linnemannia schmuckeri TaxID=64567 RepID=A0A9P5RUR8_9FUNG|nr:hypothetical protein BG015_000317 [Linnemannia schmuckeri]